MRGPDYETSPRGEDRREEAVKITDKMRLDWMEKEVVMATSPSVGWWVMFAKVCGKGSGHTFRQAIDASIQAERKRKSEVGK